MDWFPAGADNPIRVEFIGDNIESIRRYDPATQRSIVTLDQATVVPLTEASAEKEVGRPFSEDAGEKGAVPLFSTFFDYAGTRDLTLIVSEEEEVVGAGQEARGAAGRELRRGAGGRQHRAGARKSCS